MEARQREFREGAPRDGSTTPAPERNTRQPYAAEVEDYAGEKTEAPRPEIAPEEQQPAEPRRSNSQRPR